MTNHTDTAATEDAPTYAVRLPGGKWLGLPSNRGRCSGRYVFADRKAAESYAAHHPQSEVIDLG